MKKTTKLFSLIMSVIMLTSIFIFPEGFAYAKTSNPSGGLITPQMSADTDTVSLSAPAFKSSSSSAVTSASKSITYNGKTYYTEGKQLYSYIKKYTQKRSQSFNIYFASSSKLSTSDCLSIIQSGLFNSGSDELSTSATDGDYIYWSFQTTGMKRNAQTYVRKNGYYCYTLPVAVTYTVTSAQEKEIDSAVNEFISTVNFKTMTDFQIISAVRRYILDSTTYAYEAVNYGSISTLANPSAFSAYGALVKGRCVCQGYALAFYRICMQLGYDCRFVSSDPDEGCHAWNIVKLDGKYYYVDCTWDDEMNSDYYFLVNYDTLRKKDSKLKEHTLDPTYYNTSYFKTNYSSKISSKNYSAQKDNILSTCTISSSSMTYTYTGSEIKPAVTVKDDGKTLVNGTDYTVSYSDNKNTGEARITVTGKGEYSGSSATRQFFIVPKAVTNIKVASGGYSDTSVTLQWSKPSGSCSGYKIYCYKNGKWTVVKTITSSSTLKYKVTGLTAAKKYSFRIRAFKTVNNKRRFSSYREFSTSTRPKKISISSLSTKSKSVKLKWKATSGTGYQIQYSTNKNMKNAKTVKLSGKNNTSKTVSKLKKGKKYYFRIRAVNTYKDSNNKSHTVAGVWSAKKTITVK